MTTIDGGATGGYCATGNCVIDTPPTLGLITVNALVAASHVLIPIQSSYFALEGTDAKGIADLLRGPTCIAYSDDPIAAPKVAVKFAKANEKFVILGGAMGPQVLDAKGVNALATLPSLDELRGKLIGLIQAPASKIARTINEPGAQLARVFAARGKEAA